MSKRFFEVAEIFNLQMGKTPSRDNLTYWNNGDHDWVSIRDLGSYGKYVEGTKETISALGVKESGIKVVPEGTLIMSFKLSLGKTAITTKETYTNEAIMAFIDRGVAPVDLDYMYHQFSSKDWSAGTNAAVMGKTLNKKSLGASVICVPGLEEQRRVADELDCVQLQIARAELQLTMLDGLVKSRFIEMFGDPSSKEGPYPYEELGEHCNIVTGNTPPKKNPENYGPGIEWIKSDNIHPGASSLGTAKETLSEKGESVARIAEKGWLLMTCIAGSPNTIGNTAFVDRRVAFNQQINAIDPRQENAKYVQIALGLSKVRLTQNLNAALKCILNKSMLASFELAFPPVEMQEEFAAFARQVDKSKFAF